MNSNGVLEFSHVQEPQFINNQVPLENYKTGTIASLVTSQNMTTKGTGIIPVRETKGKLLGNCRRDIRDINNKVIQASKLDK